MRSMYSYNNIVRAIQHPELIWFYLQGYNRGGLRREHIKIVIRQVSNIKTHLNADNPLEYVCNAIDICQNIPSFKKKFLYLLTRKFRPVKIVETGVFAGESSTFFLKALKKYGGHLYSIDLPNVSYYLENGREHSDVLPQEFRTGFLIPEELKSNWTLIIGDSKEKLPELMNEIGEINMFFHDSVHTYDFMTFEYETVWPFIENGGLLLSDDVKWNNAFRDFCTRHSLDYKIHNGIGVTIK